MTVVVPFDGSDRARLALARGASLAADFEAELHAVTVVHPGVADPVALDWLEEGEGFDAGRIAVRLGEVVASIAPAATHHALRESRRLPRGAVAKRIRRFAREQGADLVVIGSENAGRIVTPISSVGGGVATEMAYDVYLVRRTESGLFPDVEIDLESEEEDDTDESS